MVLLISMIQLLKRYHRRSSSDRDGARVLSLLLRRRFYMFSVAAPAAAVAQEGETEKEEEEEEEDEEQELEGISISPLLPPPWS